MKIAVKGSMSKGFVGYFFYIAAVVLLVVNKVFFPQVGENVLMNKCIAGVALVLLGIWLCVIPIVQMLARKRDEAEWEMENPELENQGRGSRRLDAQSLDASYNNGGSFKSIFQIVIGIAVLFFSILNVKNCFVDMKQGAIEVVLNNTYVEESYRHSTRRYADRTTYYLYGMEGGTDEKKIKVEDIFDKQTIDRINQESPMIIVIQYPNTKAIVQFQIHYEHEVVLIPDKVIEVEPATATTEASTSQIDSTEVFATVQYKEIPLDEIGDLQEKGIEVGADLEHVTFVMMYEFIMADRYDGLDEVEEQIVINAISEEYGLAEDQTCKIYGEMMGTKELVVVYDRETLVVEDMFAREQIVVNDEE